METSEAAQLRRQLEEMQRSFEEANAARETAMEELKTTKRQVELAEAARQLHDAEARSQAVRAVSEMQKLAERRVTQAEEEAEKQIQEAERRAAEQVRAVQEDAEQRLRSVQDQTESIAAATRKLHDAEARRQALRAVSEVQKMADQRVRSEKERMDEMIAAAHEASSLQIKSAHDKAEMQIKTVQAQAEELAAARVSVAEAEQAAQAEKLMRDTRETYENRIEETRRQFEREKGEKEIQTEQAIARTIAEAEERAAMTRQEVEERARAEAERAIQDAQAAAAAERAAMLRTAEETKAQGEEMMRLSEQAVALERENREAAEQRIAEEAEARARAEQYASQAARQVQVAQIRLKAASEGALMARRALASGDPVSPEASSPATSEVGAAVQAYVDATAGETKPVTTNDIEDLSLGNWTLRRGSDGGLVWTGVRQDDLPEDGKTEHTASPANVPDALLWVNSLTTLTEGMHAPLLTWLQQLYPAMADTASAPAPAPAGDGVDAASFELLQQRCEFIEHWARTVAQHGPEMEQLIVTKNQGDPKFAFLSDKNSMEGQYYMECMARFTAAAPVADGLTEAEKVLQLIADHEAALRTLQQEAQNGQLSPAAIAKIEQVTASISKLTTQLDMLEHTEATQRQQKRTPRRSSSRPKSAKRTSSRGRQRQNMYTHGQTFNRHARPEAEPKKPRPKTPSGRNGATTPGRQGARTPGRQGARTPGRQGARTPGRQGATTPGRQGARTPGRRGTTPRGGTTPRASQGGKSPRASRPGSASRRNARGGPASVRAGPVGVQPSGKGRVPRASTAQRDAMDLVNAEAAAFSQQPKKPSVAQLPVPEPEPEAAPAPTTPKAEAKRAQSNPRSLFRRRNAKQAEETGARPAVAQPAPSMTPDATAPDQTDLELATSTPNEEPMRTTSGISLPHSSPVPPSSDPILDKITKKLRALSYGVAGQDPSKLFRHFDRDNSGELELAEFTAAVRKGAALSPADISAEDLHKIFNAADIDGDGTISIDELTQFVWGYASPRDGASPIDDRSKAAREKESRRLIAKQRKIPEKVKQLRIKLTALSYGTTGQDPALLFKHYDRDNSGELDIAEFTQAIRKGGRMTKNEITDGELRQLFRSIDDDQSGTISIEEMTEFVWGTAGDQPADHEDGHGQHHDTTQRGVSVADICETIVQEVRRRSVRVTEIFQRVEQDNRREGFPVYSPGDLDIDGLAQAVLLMGIELQVDELSMLFDAIDTNGDRLVSVQEFMHFIRRRGRPDLSPRSGSGGLRAPRPKSAKKASVGRIQRMYSSDAQRRDEKLRQQRMAIKQAQEEELRKASIPWHQQEEYKRRQKKFPVADGEAMHDRFDSWQARKQEKVEQKRASIEQEKGRQSRTPRLSSKSKRMVSGRTGNVVDSLHEWDEKKKNKLKSKQEALERAQMSEIALTPKMEKSFSKRRELRDLEADVHGHTASHIHMHAKVLRDAKLSSDSKSRGRTAASRSSTASQSAFSDVGTDGAEPAHVHPSATDDVEDRDALVEEQPVPALASSEYNHEFDSRADKLAAEMREAEEMLATGFDGDHAGQVESAFGGSGETGAEGGKHEHVVLGGQVLSLPDNSERHALFDRIDYNGNGALSLAEIDKAVVELWPQFDHKRALMRAYKAADRNDDGFIKRGEFARLLKFIVYFSELWDRFEEIDRNHDHRLNLDEFTDGCAVVGLEVEDAELCFNEIDTSGGGFILFDEFCSWCAYYHVGEDPEPLEELTEVAGTSTDASPEAAQTVAVEPVAGSEVEPAEPAEPVEPVPEQASLQSMQTEAEAQRAKFKAEQKALGLDSSDDDESDEPEATDSDRVASTAEPPPAQEAQQFDDRAGQLAAEMDEATKMLEAAVAVDEDFASMAAIVSGSSQGPSQAQQDLEALLGGSDAPLSPGAGVGAALVPVSDSSMGDALSRIPVASTVSAAEDVGSAQDDMKLKMAEMEASLAAAAATAGVVATAESPEGPVTTMGHQSEGSTDPAADDYESFLNSFENH